MRVTIGVKIFGIAVGFADPGLTVTVLNASQGSSPLTLRWREMDSNLRSPGTGSIVVSIAGAGR
jgi:hypothetical protein